MKKIIVIVIAAFIQACAFTDAKLNVEHDPSENYRGPVSEAPATDFLPSNLSDARDDQQRIGWKKNGFGQNTADITTARPVTGIVKDAIATGLTQNEHRVSDDGRVKVEGTVDRFWFETDVNFWTVGFTGDVQCSLVFIDTQSGDRFYSSTYSGTYTEKKAAGLNKTWEHVMSQAVNMLIEDITFDEGLMMALEELPQ